MSVGVWCTWCFELRMIALYIDMTVCSFFSVVCIDVRSIVEVDCLAIAVLQYK